MTDWLQNIDWKNVDWGLVAISCVAAAFLWLVVKAVIRLRKGPLPATTEAAEEASKTSENDQIQHDTSQPTEASSEAEAATLARGLMRTRGGFMARLSGLIRGKSGFDETMLEAVEEVLFTADIGVKTAQDLIDSIRKELSKNDQTDADAVWAHLKQKSTDMMGSHNAPPIDWSAGNPFVLLVVGVNGAGKTTTIGKLAAKLAEQGKRVMLAAGDTFRAAAAQQLEVWGDRIGVPVVSGAAGADPSSVIVDAIKQAKSGNFDLVIADTAGRLHTKSSLMDELKKVRRSIAKQIDGAPHETFLVLDATTGQNAIAQAQMFGEAIELTGLIMTKLDGTAKGGVLLGIRNETEIPVRFIGIGESVKDLRPFVPKAFVEALFADTNTPTPQ